MKKNEISITYTEFESMGEMPEDDQLLLLKAKEAIKSAYAPYSHYYVGAAVKLINGEVFTGNNQENVAYPSGLCAERVAIFTAVSQYPGVPVETVAIAAQARNFTIDSPVAPCGACRQVMAEYEILHNNPIRIILAGEKGKIYLVESTRDILPLMFHAEELKK